MRRSRFSTPTLVTRTTSPVRLHPSTPSGSVLYAVLIVSNAAYSPASQLVYRARFADVVVLLNRQNVGLLGVLR
jgi:hypothetical protein